MKKTLLSIAACASILATVAQEPIQLNDKSLFDLPSTIKEDAFEKVLKNNEIRTIHNDNSRSNSSSTAWLDFIASYENAANLSTVASYPYLTSDSLLDVAIDGDDFNFMYLASGCYGSVTQTLDLSSQIFGGTDTFNLNSTHEVDSALIYYAYTRGKEQSTSSVDTLIVNVVDSSGIFLALSNSRIPWPLVRYDYTKNAPHASAITSTHKLPLSASDSTGGYFGEFKIPVGLNLGAAERAAISVSFKSADTYVDGDTVINATSGENGKGEKMGRMQLLMVEEKSGSVVESYAMDSATHWTFNQAGVVDRNILYNENQYGWNGYHVPSGAYNSSFAQEQLYVLWKVTSTFESNISTGIEEFNNALNIYPNPATDVLNLSLTQNAKIEIINLFGQTVLSTNESIGSIALDISDLATGTYVMNVTSNTRTTTTKIMIQ